MKRKVEADTDTGTTNNKVSIKGIRGGIMVSFDTDEAWQPLIDELTARIDERLSFYAGAAVTVDLGARAVPKYALRTLKAALERRGLTLAVVLSASQTSLDAAVDLDLRTSVGGHLPGHELNDTLPDNPEEADVLPGVMVRKTLRSGRTVHSDGHVVVYGDVNAGAEIIAAGDVLVWGALRGSVQAGHYGDTEAVVCALEMTPTRLMIAGHIADEAERRPSLRRRRRPRPEVARLHEGRILFDAWDR